MLLENQEKMLVELAEETLKADKVKKFIQFCLNQSDEIVVCQLGLRNGSKKTLNHVQFIKCEETHETHCTRGPLTTVYHIKNDTNIKQKLDGLKDIYGPICLDEKGEEIVEDPAFIKRVNCFVLFVLTRKLVDYSWMRVNIKNFIAYAFHMRSLILLNNLVLKSS